MLVVENWSFVVVVVVGGIFICSGASNDSLRAEYNTDDDDGDGDGVLWFPFGMTATAVASVENAFC